MNELKDVVDALSTFGFVESFENNGEIYYKLADNPPNLLIEEKKVDWAKVPGENTAEKMNYVLSFMSGTADVAVSDLGNQAAWIAGNKKNQPAWLEVS